MHGQNHIKFVELTRFRFDCTKSNIYLCRTLAFKSNFFMICSAVVVLEIWNKFWRWL